VYVGGTGRNMLTWSIKLWEVKHSEDDGDCSLSF